MFLFLEKSLVFLCIIPETFRKYIRMFVYMYVFFFFTLKIVLFIPYAKVHFRSIKGMKLKMK